MCLFCYIVLPNALLSVTMSLLWEIMLSIRILTVILPVIKVLRRKVVLLFYEKS